jgi:hypothetical protein
MAQTIPLQLLQSLPATIPNAMEEGAPGGEVAPVLCRTWSKRDSYSTQRTVSFSEKPAGWLRRSPCFIIRPSEIGAGSFPSPAPFSRQQHVKVNGMDRAEITVRNVLTAIEPPLYDIGVLSDRGMLPGLDGISAETVLARLPLLKNRNARGSHIYIRPAGEHRYTALDDLSEISLGRLAADGFTPCAVVETSAGNYQAWLKHSVVFPKLVSTFVAQTLAARYDADPSAADWRRFGRLPGFTTCKPKYKRPDGLFPFVRLKSHSGEQYPEAEAFAYQIIKRYQAQEQEREAKRREASLSPQRGPRLSNVSLERFRTSSKYRDRPAAADIAFCVAAYADGMTEDRMERALDEEYLSRDPSPSKRAAYIRRTMEKARRWAER